MRNPPGALVFAWLVDRCTFISQSMKTTARFNSAQTDWWCYCCSCAVFKEGGPLQYHVVLSYLPIRTLQLTLWFPAPASFLRYSLLIIFQWHHFLISNVDVPRVLYNSSTFSKLCFPLRVEYLFGPQGSSVSFVNSSNTCFECFQWLIAELS